MNGYFLYGIGIIAVIGILPFCACHFRAHGGVPLVSSLPILPRQTLPFNTSTNKFAALPQTFSEKVVGYPRNSRHPVVQDQAILNYRAEPRILATHVPLWFCFGSAFFLIPSSQATLVSLLCRVWMLSAELVLAGVAVFLHKRTEAR